MGQMIKFPDGMDFQLCATPGLGQHTQEGLAGRSTLMINMYARLFFNEQRAPVSEYYFDVEKLTPIGSLCLAIMDKNAKDVSETDSSLKKLF